MTGALDGFRAGVDTMNQSVLDQQNQAPNVPAQRQNLQQATSAEAASDKVKIASLQAAEAHIDEAIIRMDIEVEKMLEPFLSSVPDTQGKRDYLNGILMVLNGMVKSVGDQAKIVFSSEASQQEMEDYSEQFMNALAEAKNVALGTLTNAIETENQGGSGNLAGLANRVKDFASAYYESPQSLKDALLWLSTNTGDRSKSLESLAQGAFTHPEMVKGALRIMNLDNRKAFYEQLKSKHGDQRAREFILSNIGDIFAPGDMQDFGITMNEQERADAEAKYAVYVEKRDKMTRWIHTEFGLGENAALKTLTLANIGKTVLMAWLGAIFGTNVAVGAIKGLRTGNTKKEKFDNAVSFAIKNPATIGSALGLGFLWPSGSEKPQTKEVEATVSEAKAKSTFTDNVAWGLGNFAASYEVGKMPVTDLHKEYLKYLDAQISENANNHVERRKYEDMKSASIIYFEKVNPDDDKLFNLMLGSLQAGVQGAENTAKEKFEKLRTQV